jgi:hypothetical protein
LKKRDRCLIEDLRSSTEKIGDLYPILEDFYGNIIDGKHRLEANKGWPRRRLENVKTERDRIIVKLVSNACRRTMSSQEKKDLLKEMGGVLLQEGVQRGEISKRISEESGMSYTWVMKYLPGEFKDQLQSERASSATRHGAEIAKILRILKPPRQKLLEIQKYRNANNVLVFINKALYKRIEKTCEMLSTTPEILVQNIIEGKLTEISAYDRDTKMMLQRKLMLHACMPCPSNQCL